MSTEKLVLWLIAALGVLFVLYIVISAILNKTKRSSDGAEKANSKTPISEDARKQMHDRLESLTEVIKIEEKARKVVANYDELSEDAKRHLVASVIGLTFLGGSQILFEAFDNGSNFSLTSPTRTTFLELLYRGFVKSEGYVTIQKEQIEDDFLNLSKLQKAECPIYSLFSQINKESETGLMSEVGIEAKFAYKPKGEGEKNLLRTRTTPVLDIKKTMKNRSEEIKLSEYLKTLVFPHPESNSLYHFDESAPGAFYRINNVFIFYSDFSDEPSMNMPDKMELGEYKDSTLKYTYRLKSVILREGDKNDIYKMKVMHMPSMFTLRSLLNDANKKGCFFLYEKSLY
ncbi:hypothetical protein ENBRE01_2982 [Enteropsectra breve]|nr:hypothetical protein ENBRE01_2982 [Enteropsectra breve]